MRRVPADGVRRHFEIAVCTMVTVTAAGRSGHGGRGGATEICASNAHVRTSHFWRMDETNEKELRHGPTSLHAAELLGSSRQGP